MENGPKKRGRKLGSSKEVPHVKPPPKKRGRKPKKKIITNENPIFADDNLNMEDLIIRGERKVKLVYLIFIAN